MKAHWIKHKQLIPLAAILLLFALHLPFLQADPDSSLSLSRGPWTDPGFHTLQVRNFLNTGAFDIQAAGAIIKTPLFGGLLLPFYALFGVDILVGRLIVLCIALMALLLFLLKKETRIFALIFLTIGYTQYHLFHFMHIGLPEFAAIGCILVSVYSLTLYFHHRASKTLLLLMSALFLSLAYYFKNQYIYIVPVLPVTVLVVTLMNQLSEARTIDTSVLRPLLLAVSFLGAFLMIYVVAWYLPHFNFYNWVMELGISNRVEQNADYSKLFRDNYEYIVSLPGVDIYELVFYAAAPVFLLLLFLRRENRWFLVPSVFGLFWLLAELHVLSLRYIPARYYLHLLVAAIFVISLTLAELANWKQWLMIPVVAIVMFLLVHNAQLYHDSYRNRTFVMKATNRYLKNADLKGETIMGNWAASLAWGTGARCLPVTWNRYNDKNIFQRFQPRLIISEDSQGESNSAYARQNIQLEEKADSVRTFTINNRDLNFFWFP